MIGAIIGDIAGSRFEFNNARNDDFELLDPKECNFTDDTICTVAVADALLHGKSFREALVEWGFRYPNPMGGYGASYCAWLKSVRHLPYNSYGNGAAMRVSAIGWLSRSEDQAIALAEESAEVSHNHPEGIKGATTSALAVYFLRHATIDGEDSIEAFKHLIETNYGAIPEWKPFSNPFDESCQNAIPVAASCFLASKDFEDAIRKAILVGGDSDTIAAIIGSWAQAYYEDMPEHLVEKALKFLPQPMMEVFSEFLDVCIKRFGRAY